MRFVQFRIPGLDPEPMAGRLMHAKTRIGVELSPGGDVVDLAAADPDRMPTNLVDFIAHGESAMERAQSIVSTGLYVLPRDKLHILAPMTKAGKVFNTALNYEGIPESIPKSSPYYPVEQPKEPLVFNQVNSAIHNPFDDLVFPRTVKELDWEVELAIIIGKTARDVPKEKAMEYVFGYTVAWDVSARDWQARNGGQWFLGKSMDSFCPLGPAAVTLDELDDPHNLELRCRVNGVTKQAQNSKELVYKTQDIIAHLTRFITLCPGDVILTGSPVGIGVFHDPPEYLKIGDVVECEIEKIGTIRNKLV